MHNMWNANVLSSSFNLGTLNVLVMFSNGISSYSETFSVTSASDLQNVINDKLTRLNVSDSFNKSIVLGPFVSTTVSSTSTVKPPTVSDNFFSSLRQLQSAKRAVDLGIITSSDSNYVSALQTVKNAYVSSYIGTI